MQQVFKGKHMTRKGYDHNQGYYDMMNNKEFTDVTLVTNDKKETRAHKLILSAASPFLKNMMLKDEESIRIHADSNLLSSVLEFIYLREVTINDAMIIQFVKLLTKLQIGDDQDLEESQHSDNDQDATSNTGDIQESHYSDIDQDETSNNEECSCSIEICRSFYVLSKL